MNKYFAATVEEIKVIGKKIVCINQIEIGIFCIKNRYFAWRNVCPHAGAPVCKGIVNGTTLPTNVYEYEFGCEDQILRCPWHGWEFDLTDGHHLAADSKAKLRGYATTVEEDKIYVVMA